MRALLRPGFDRPRLLRHRYPGADPAASTAYTLLGDVARASGNTSEALLWFTAAVTLWLWHVASDDARWMYDGGLTLAALATALVIAHSVVSPRSPTARLLALAPLVWLGRISYGVYLWHWPMFTFVNADSTGLSRWPLLAVRLLGTLAVSIVSFYLIEQPIRKGALVRMLPRRAPIGVTAPSPVTTTLRIPRG